MGICFTFWCTTCRNLWHGIPEPARSLGVIEGALYVLHTNRVRAVTSGHCSSFVQLGFRKVSFTVHACQAPHRDMASRTCEGLHPLDAPHPGCLWMDQVTLCVMIREKPALVPSESPHLLALCLNFQPLESLLWVKAVVPEPLSPPLVQRILF